MLKWYICYFRYIGIADAVLSFAYLFILIVCLFLDRPLSGTVTYNESSFASLISSFGGFSFAYGVGPSLSNILMDLEDRSMFTNTCATGFLGELKKNLNLKCSLPLNMYFLSCTQIWIIKLLYQLLNSDNFPRKDFCISGWNSYAVFWGNLDC